MSIKYFSNEQIIVCYGIFMNILCYDILRKKLVHGTGRAATHLGFMVYAEATLSVS